MHSLDARAAGVLPRRQRWSSVAAPSSLRRASAGRVLERIRGAGAPPRRSRRRPARRRQAHLERRRLLQLPRHQWPGRAQRRFPGGAESAHLGRSTPTPCCRSSNAASPDTRMPAWLKGAYTDYRLLRQSARPGAGRYADQRRLQRRGAQGPRRLHPDQFHEAADADMVRSIALALALLLASTRSQPPPSSKSTCSTRPPTARDGVRAAAHQGRRRRHRAFRRQGQGPQRADHSRDDPGRRDADQRPDRPGRHRDLHGARASTASAACRTSRWAWWRWSWWARRRRPISPAAQAVAVPPLAKKRLDPLSRALGSRAQYRSRILGRREAGNDP